jgi:hypothetical protein
MEKPKLFQFQSRKQYIPAEDKAMYGGLDGEHNIGNAFDLYIQGYVEAAKSLQRRFEEAAKDGNIGVQDTICYPIIYIHRHCLELYIKSLLGLLNPGTDEWNKILGNSHDLKKSWEYVKPKLCQISKRVGYDLNTDYIEAIISAFQQNDVGSFNYRYPVTTASKLIHPKYQSINMTNFNDVMFGLYKYLNAMKNYLGARVDNWDYSIEFKQKFDKDLDVCSEQFENISTYLKYSGQMTHIKDEAKGKQWLKMSDIIVPSEEEQRQECELFSRFNKCLTESQRAVLVCLFETGEVIDSYNLAIDQEERSKDIYQMLYSYSNFREGELHLNYQGAFEHIMHKPAETVKCNINKMLMCLSHQIIE